MKSKEAKVILEQKLNATLWLHETNSVYEFAESKEELIDWIEDADFFTHVKTVPEDIDEIKVKFYGVTAADDEDYLVRIVVDVDKKVIAYGYTHD